MYIANSRATTEQWKNKVNLYKGRENEIIQNARVESWKFNGKWNENAWIKSIIIEVIYWVSNPSAEEKMHELSNKLIENICLNHSEIKKTAYRKYS